METKLKTGVRRWLIFFIIALLLSGITAFGVETGLHWILSWWPDTGNVLGKWLVTCYKAIKETNTLYPYIAYGYDWLAFAHIVIAIAFVGPLIDPVKNIWVIQFGCIACMLIIPLAFVAGHVRHIPVFWRFIDCAFGIIGFVPLWICYKKTRQLEQLYITSMYS